ncbi:DUF4282 domain-containing protein [Sulfurimonas sp.]
MWNILTFNTFVAQDVLLVFYYVCALFVPIIIWKLRFYAVKKFSLSKSIDDGIKNFYTSLDTQQRFIVLTVFIIIFFCMELCLRMIFEAMIGYFDMHDYLYEISQELQKK